MAIEIRNKKELIQAIQSQQSEIDMQPHTLYKLARSSSFKEQGQWIHKFVRYNYNELKIPNYKYVYIVDFLKIVRIYLILGVLYLSWFFTYSYHKLRILGKRSFNEWESWIYIISTCIYILAIVLILLKIYFSKDTEEDIANSKTLFVSKYYEFLLRIEARIDNLSEKEVQELLKNISIKR